MGSSELSTKEKLLAAAKEEFLEKGYLQASLRDIAARAQVTTGALYRSFADKAELFDQVLKPARDTVIQAWIEVTEKPEYNPSTEQAMHTDLYDREVALYHDYVGVIFDHPEEMHLLVVSAEGSPSDGFFRQLSELGMLGAMDFLVQGSNETTLSELGVTKDLKRILSTPIQQFFTWIVKDDVSKEEALRSCELLLLYSLSGWRTLFVYKAKQDKAKQDRLKTEQADSQGPKPDA